VGRKLLLTNNKFLRFISLITCSSIAADYPLNLFGKSRITAFSDNNQQMQINFEGWGSQWLYVEFATPNLA
jgi:hypothetical protein